MDLNLTEENKPSQQREEKAGLSNNFVLKLRIEGTEEATKQIHRVRLSRITVNGEISYPDLVDIAIQCTFPDAAPLVSENYTVLLTYYDVDNDCVTIASTEELIDAIEQFTRPGSDALCLRIKTDVKLKSKSSFSTPFSPRRGFKTNNSTKEGLPAGHIVESFVSILTDAVDTLQSRVAESYSKKEPGTSKERTPSKAQSCQRACDKSKSDELNQKHEIESNQESKCENLAKETKQSENEERLFIHNRHTCDSCLCTPIIGPRYHSTNMPDYDLCAKCRNNYKGDQIQFETVELERDCPFQKRWNRKLLRRSGRGGSWRHNNCRGRQNSLKHRMESNDPDIKEAIRRSLRDISPKRDSSIPTTPPKNEVERSNSRNIDSAEETAQVLNKTKEKVEKELIKDLFCGKDNKDYGVSNPPTPAVKEEEIIVSEQIRDKDMPLDSCKESLRQSLLPEALIAENLSHNEDNKDYENSDPTTPTLKEEEIILSEQLRDEYMLSSFCKESSGQSLLPEARAAEKMETITNDENLDNEDSEFNNDMASSSHNTNSGQTILSEVADSTKEKDNGHVEDVTDLNETVVSTNKNDNMSKMDEAVNAEDKEKVGSDCASNTSEDEWQVVTDSKKSGNDEHTSNDAMIAQAAQMLGSALFESDLLHSENFSSMTNSDSLSIPSSVPTVSLLVESELPSNVLDQWGNHLFQLHELGFHDDKKSIEILDRLTAANIGVDSDDEVSVEQVINELLNN